MYYVNEQKAKRQCFHTFKSFPLNQDQKLVKKINYKSNWKLKLMQI